MVYIVYNTRVYILHICMYICIIYYICVYVLYIMYNNVYVYNNIYVLLCSL